MPMKFNASLEHLGEMLGFIRSFLQSQNCASAFIRKVELASEEALVNIISYSHSKNRDVFIDISCEKKADGKFQITIIDDGLPFNPKDYHTQVDFNLPIEDRKIGGLGIYLMHKLCKDIEYQRDDDKNILKLIFEN